MPGRIDGMDLESSSLQRTEQALLDSEDRLQQVLDNSGAIVFAKDSVGRYLFVNASSSA